MSLVLALVLFAAACRVDTSVDVTVHADGSGTVRMRALLDGDARRRVPVSSIRLDDLRAAGWSVSRDATSVSLAKPFASASELAPTLRELAGATEVLRAASLERTTSFLRARESLRIDVDLRALSSGVATDSDLAARLRAAGVDPGALASQLDASVRSAVGVEVRARLPGVTRTWRAAPGGHLSATVTSSTWNGARYRWLIAAIVLAALAVAVGATALIRGGRGGRRARGGTRAAT